MPQLPCFQNDSEQVLKEEKERCVGTLLGEKAVAVICT